MSSGSKNGPGESRPALLVALLISLLLHYPIVAIISALVEGEPIKPEKRLEVSLLSEEPTPVPQPLPKAEPRPAPPAPQPPAPIARQKPITPKTKSKRTPHEPVEGIPSAPPSPEPLGTSEPLPETSEPHLEKVEIEMDWAVFEKAFADRAKREREQYQKESMERRRGGLKFGSLSGKVRRALKSNSSWVTAGEQEPLGKRKKVFRNYLHVIHDRIHALFADSFLGSLTSLDPSDPLNNFDLNAKLEFEILKTGQVNDVHVIKSSGMTVFDAAAVDSIYRSAPYHPPPQVIMSWNERVYLRWGFYRNNRKCGPFNAEPYILRAPGASPEQITEDDLRVDDG